MVLESCMILLDNSEHMRNGDYIPSRLEAQHDAANFLIGRKTQSNPENTVGVIAMSSSSESGAELLVSPTDDMGKILGAVHDVSIQPTTSIDLTVSIQVASLALKHRRNKNGSQRIIVFVGSPLDSKIDGRALAKAGKMLKKNNVAIDIVAMGELEDNQQKLEELVAAAKGSSFEDCHLVTIPAGVLPSDVLISSPIVSGPAGANAGGAPESNDLDMGGGGSGGGFAEFGGVDPNMDPELAMALRVSMEEERARQERIAASSAAEETKQDSNMEIDATPAPSSNEVTPTTNLATLVQNDGNVEVTEEDALLQQALAMSMAEGNEEEGVEVAAASPPVQTMDAEEDDEDAAIQLALQMSMQPDADDNAEQEADTTASSTQQFQDPNFVNQLLGSLPGVNASDPAIQNALRNLQSQQGEEEKQEKKDEDEKEDSK